MIMKDFTFADRYSALGIPRPNPDTICKGACEGTGKLPVFRMKAGLELSVVRLLWETPGDTDKRLTELWNEAEEKHPSKDGWHFVECPDCGGTGKRRGIQ